jgi:hypothetical protein
LSIPIPKAIVAQTPTVIIDEIILCFLSGLCCQTSVIGFALMHARFSRKLVVFSVQILKTDYFDGTMKSIICFTLFIRTSRLKFFLSKEEINDKGFFKLIVC